MIIIATSHALVIRYHRDVCGPGQLQETQIERAALRDVVKK